MCGSQQPRLRPTGRIEVRLITLLSGGLDSVVATTTAAREHSPPPSR